MPVAYGNKLQAMVSKLYSTICNLVNGIPWVTAAPAQQGELSWTMKVDDRLSNVANDMDAKNSLDPLIN